MSLLLSGSPLLDNTLRVGYKISAGKILSELLCQQDLSGLSLSRRHESCLERVGRDLVSELSNV